MSLVVLTGILEELAVFCERYASTPAPYASIWLRHSSYFYCADARAE